MSHVDVVYGRDFNESTKLEYKIYITDYKSVLANWILMMLNHKTSNVLCKPQSPTALYPAK